MKVESATCDVALIGLGVMGANLARNFARTGMRVAVYDRVPEATRALAERHPEARLVACTSLEELARALRPPRIAVLLVPAGAPVDEALEALARHLAADDIVVDAGNSLHLDTDRRTRDLAARGQRWHFVGMGVSGGSEGALTGPALMPGGPEAAWRRLRPLLEPIAARAGGEPCVAYCGAGSAGHFVKMVHNGIEYGDMQLIAEIAFLMRRGLGWSGTRAADVFSAWNGAELESYLVEITASILRTEDPERPGGLLLDAVLDRAGQKGTGRWTIEAAQSLGVAIPTISAAVDARIQSAAWGTRARASALFGEGAPTTGDAARAALAGLDADDLRDALYAAKIASYSQGFELLDRGSAAFAFGTDLAEVARIWRAGCIIRARFLDDVREAFATPRDGASTRPLLALTSSFAARLRERLPCWRRVVTTAIAAGVPIPGLSASLAWFDGLRTARGSADLIQAQRDHFGHHGYERLDAPGRVVHTDWETARRRS